MMNHLVVTQKLAIMRMMMMRQQLTVMMAMVVVEVLASHGLIHGLGLEAGGRGTAYRHKKVKSKRRGHLEVLLSLSVFCRCYVIECMHFFIFLQGCFWTLVCIYISIFPAEKRQVHLMLM
jgi:hypothetical protein